jgi:hypothetical protein
MAARTKWKPVRVRVRGPLKSDVGCHAGSAQHVKGGWLPKQDLEELVRWNQSEQPTESNGMFNFTICQRIATGWEAVACQPSHLT